MSDSGISLDRLYQDTSAGIRSTDDISFKLLGLVPLLSGASMLTLLLKDPIPPSRMPLLYGLSLFAALVTLGLFRWELRNIQTCKWLRERADCLEQSVALPPGLSPLQPLPGGPQGIGKTEAEKCVYAITVLSWLGMPWVLYPQACDSTGGLVYAGLAGGVALATLIIGLLPVTVPLVGARPGEGVALRRLALPLGLIVAGGVCINVSVFTQSQGAGIGKQAVGVLGALLALAVWTVYAVWNARRLAATPKFNSHEWSLLTGVATGLLSLLLVIPAFLLGGTSHAPAAHTPEAWGWFWAVSFAVAIGASVIGNGLWNAASRYLPLSLSGQLIVFETLFALLYGFLHEGRWPRGLETAAIVLMLAGVLWSVRLHRPAKAALAAA